MSREPDLKINRKLSFFVGYLPDGTPEVVVTGTASEAWEAFKNERDNFDNTGKSKFIELAYYRGVNTSKRRQLVKADRQSVSLDWSEFENDPEGMYHKRLELGLVSDDEKKAREQADRQASEVIQDTDKELKKPAKKTTKKV